MESVIVLSNGQLVSSRVGARVGRAVLNLVSLSADGAGNSFPVSESVS